VDVDVESLFGWISQQKFIKRSQEKYDPILFFNKYASYKGHSLAFSKMKAPMTFNQLLAFSPEFGKKVDISIYAIKKSITVPFFSEYNDPETYIKLNFPDLCERFNSELVA
jgi:siderophore synthetase component